MLACRVPGQKSAQLVSTEALSCCGTCLQSIMSELSAMLDHRDGPDSFLDAETATFASRIKRLIKTKADELQKCVPGRPQRGSDSGRWILISCSMLQEPE